MVRNLPYILSVGVVGLVIEFTIGNPHLATQATIVQDAVTIVAACAAVYLWFWPMVRWKGGLVHDRRLGLQVVRTGRR